METLLGLLMITGQVMGIVLIFGGWKSCPKWLRIAIGIAQILIIIAIFGMSDGM